MGVIGVFKKGIDFEKTIPEPVKVVILIIVPKNRFDHLVKVHTVFSNIFKNRPAVLAQIVKAKSEVEVFEILTEDELDSQNYFLDDGMQRRKTDISPDL